MQRTLEYSPIHSQIVQKFQTMFPSLSLPQIDYNISTFDALNDIIRNIPRPATHQTRQTISNMKNYVDGQELRIQMNMIQLEQTQPIPLHLINKKYTIDHLGNLEGPWLDGNADQEGNWEWESKSFQYLEQHELSSFLD